MSLTNNRQVTRTRIEGLTSPVGLFDGNANLVKAIPLIMDGNGETGELAYSATAEDAGTPGDLDGQPGLIYTGTPGGFVNVQVSDFDVKASPTSATTPESSAFVEAGEIAAVEDSVSLNVFINSDIAGHCDEGSVVEMDTATAEFNMDQQIGPLVSGDVIRLGLVWTGEADADLSLPTAGAVRII